MKKITAVFISVMMIGYMVQGQNILLKHNSEPINFSNLNAANVHDAVVLVIKSSDEAIKKITAAAGRQTLDNTLFAYDALQYELADLGAKLGLINSTYADDSIRNAAFEEADKLQNYFNNLYLNEPLYKALKKFKTAKDGSLSAPQQKFLSDAMVAFEKNGMKLDVTGRKHLEALNKKIVELGNQFDRNIAESKDSIEFTAAALKGVPAETLNAWKRGNDKYVVYVNGPNYINLTENADLSATRRTMYLHYNNRAYPKNIAVLDSLLYYRNRMAKTLGFSSYAAYSVVDKMAASPANVWTFEYDLIKKLTPLVTAEVKTMTDLKQQLLPGEPKTLSAWDYAYLQKKLLSSKYQLNTDEVKEYFEMNNTLRGMFTVYENLLGIQIKEASGVPVWDSKVKTFEIWKDGVKSGNFYLDLFPRQNKYTHFACFPINQYRKANELEVLPAAALVCNFPEGNAEQPSLLKHTDVITMFHEFGHLVDWLLCHPAIASQNAFANKGDFIEAPSQFLENWCWEYDALKLFAKNYKTGEPLPASLFAKMKQAQLVNAGSYNIRQVYLGITDFTFEDKYEETKSKGTMQVAKDNFKLSQIPFPEGTHFICSFTHLSGYAANYYGYLWSKVYAQDMFSVFKKNGVMDKATGIRYRKGILEKGATEPEIKMVETFLGRKSNSDAFLESLGIKK
jgi:Zn-dependent oligopeptidase